MVLKTFLSDYSKHQTFKPVAISPVHLGLRLNSIDQFSERQPDVCT